jgi:hypothetical protein
MLSLARPAEPRHPPEPEFWAFVQGYLHLAGAQSKALLEGLPAAAGAVPLPLLSRYGLQDPHFLWMLYQGHADHYRTAAGAPGPKARPVQTLVLGPTSALALTEVGWEFVGYLLGELWGHACDGEPTPTRDGLLLGRLVPRYEQHDRLFCWGRHVLKHFLQPAGNQQVVLCAAEEQSWPGWFDDPLPKVSSKNPKVRLHDTIKDLNRRQMVQVIRFKGDGTGTRIGWEYR